MDLLWNSTRAWKPWLTALASGPVFVLSLVAVEWPFADFLMTKAAANRFFGTTYFGYPEPPTSFDVLRRFVDPQHGMALWNGLALVFMIAAVWFGKVWWKGEADNYARYVYKPLTMQALLEQSPNAGPALKLKIEDPGWLKSRKIDDFVLDHDHLMHLYFIRKPGMDVVYHLHPEQIAPGEFQLALPSIPAGTYSLYADVVHATGFPETLVTQLTLPEIAGRPLTGDDAKGLAQALNPARVDGDSCPASPIAESRFLLPDGYTMVWDNPETLSVKTPQIFGFSLLDVKGKPASDTALYMGMLGHAAFVKDDGTVFAHVHPSGTVSMAALMMAEAQNRTGASKSDEMASMPGMAMPAASNAPTELPNTVGFPYGFPAVGAYRIFVQMKHGNTIETAAFDACAAASRN
jgi:hypothetical protein